MCHDMLLNPSYNSVTCLLLIAVTERTEEEEGRDEKLLLSCTVCSVCKNTSSDDQISLLWSSLAQNFICFHISWSLDSTSEAFQPLTA